MRNQGRLQRFRQRIGGLANAELARRLLQRLRGQKGLPKQDHLKNQIAKLDRGDSRWWESSKRQYLLEGLAEILEASPQDLLQPARPAAAGPRFPVPEWPELGDLD